MPDLNRDVTAHSGAMLRFLTFRVGERAYALPTEDVAEVVRMPAMTRVPQSPDALLGIANLRGAVLPVVSLRGLHGDGPGTTGVATRAIVLEVGAPVALVVDSVDSLVSVPADGVETREAELATEPGERLTGAFQTGPDRRVARIIDIRGLLDSTFAQRSRTKAPVRRLGEAAQGEKAAIAVDKAEMLVTFEVAGQEFGLDLDVVQEILPAPATFIAVPRAEALVIGMTSHRDALLPLLSLRGLLGFPVATTSNGREKIVVMVIAGVRVGLVADRARSIVAARAALIDLMPPILASRAGGEARIRAIYRGDSGRRLVSILAPEQLFREEVMQRLTAGNRNQLPQASPTPGAAGDEINFLVFRLGDDEFGLPIESVDEVAQVPAQITRLPKAPKFLEGVINLRGEVLPVVDQRRRFDMPPAPNPQLRRLIVVRTEGNRAGLIVDGVSDVLRVARSAVGPAPDLTEETARLVHGVINLQEPDRIVLVLDPTELLTRAERGLLSAFQLEAGHAEA